MNARKWLVRSLLFVGVAIAAVTVARHTVSHADAAEAMRLDSVSLQKLDGATESLSRYNGKIVVVNFWAPWCAPCRREVPDFVALQQKYSKDVQFVGIALDDPGPVSSFAHDYGINYPLYLAGNAGVAMMLRDGDTRGVVPYTLVIDQRGEQVATHTGQVNREGLDTLLARLTSNAPH